MKKNVLKRLTVFGVATFSVLLVLRYLAVDKVRSHHELSFWEPLILVTKATFEGA
jgi:hypothetical protein